MKKNLKRCLLTVALVLGAFVGVQNVSAATLDYDWTGIWYERQDQYGGNHSSWKLEDYRVDGQTAFCIEPGVPEGNPMYQADWSATGLSNDIKERVLLIGYYGYTYPGHQTLQYRAATQGMIWATILGNNTTVAFNYERWSAGTPYDVSSEMAEIERLISTHYTRPSFNGQTYTLQVGQSITLTDTNNVLENYSVSVSGADYNVNGNTLTITPKQSGNITLTLRKNMPYSSEAKIFVGDHIQNMLVPGTTDPVVAQVKINSYLGDVSINKSDIETGSQAQGQATLEGAVYGVYDATNNELVTKITTDKNGNGKSDKVLKYGSYYLQEITPSKGYYLDNTRYSFDSKGQASVSKNVKEIVIKNYISILKQYDYVEGTTQFLNAEANITFDIFYPDGKKYGSVTTDKNGYATLEIPYGVWKFHQVNTNTGFEKIYDFFITVDENSPLEHYYNILNNKLSAYLKVIKVDTETNKTIELANTSFKIYNVDTKQYVSQYVGGKVHDTFYTDEKGTLTTYLKLEASNYRLVEIKSPNGYLRENKGLDFTIGENTHYNYTTYGAFITVYFKNTPIKGQIEVNKTGESLKIENGSFNYETINLGGVKFEIYADEDILTSDGNHMYYHKGDLVDTIITDKNGYAISGKLPLGKYFIVETKTLEDYILDTTEFHFELTEKDDKTAIVYKSYSNLNYLEKGNIEFTKTDLVTGEVIPNTIIEIYTEKDELIFTGKTDENGKVIIEDLKVGKYYIVEKSPATGYVLNNEKVYFEIKDNGEIVKANMTNKPITGKLEFTKNDLSTDEPLPNTLIEIYNDKDELVFSGKTDDEGKIVIEELRYGKYYIIEKEAPEGYTLNTEKMWFEILEDGEIIKSTMKDKLITGTLEFTKVDISTSEPLPNTLIEIYNDKDELIFSGKTDETGKVIIEELKYGKYYIIEKEAPEGYTLNPEKMYFEILEDGKIVKASMSDEKIVEVPNTFKNDDLTLGMVGLIILGSGVIVYGTIKNKKKKNK